MHLVTSSLGTLLANTMTDPTEPDSYMIRYYPVGVCEDYDSATIVFLKKDQVYSEDRRIQFLNRVQAWLKRQIKKPVILAIAPGHKENPNPEGFLYDIVKEFRRKNPTLVVDFITLCRIKGVSKSTETPGLRYKSKHSGTIAVKKPEVPSTPPDHTGTVVILDDVWTSGSTLCACKDVVEAEYPNVSDVKLFAIGRTESR